MSIAYLNNKNAIGHARGEFIAEIDVINNILGKLKNKYVLSRLVTNVVTDVHTFFQNSTEDRRKVRDYIVNSNYIQEIYACSININKDKMDW